MDTYEINLSDNQSIKFIQEKYGMNISVENAACATNLNLTDYDKYELKEVLRKVFDFPDDPMSDWGRIEMNEGFL